MIGEAAADSPPYAAEGTPENQQQEKPWHLYISEDLPRTVQESADSAVRSARSLQQHSSTHIRTLQDLVPQYTSQYRRYEDAFFSKIKDQLTIAREYSSVTAGIAITAGLLLMRGPRRFLFRRTLGRFQTEEAQITKAANNVNHLTISVQLMKKESEKLVERAAFAEKEMSYGYGELRSVGGQIKSLAKSVYKVEGEANDLMDVLREIPGRDALRLRAEVASMASSLKERRIAMNKKIVKISELGIRV